MLLPITGSMQEHERWSASRREVLPADAVSPKHVEANACLQDGVPRTSLHNVARMMDNAVEAIARGRLTKVASHLNASQPSLWLCSPLNAWPAHSAARQLTCKPASSAACLGCRVPQAL